MIGQFLGLLTSWNFVELCFLNFAKYTLGGISSVQSNLGHRYHCLLPARKEFFDYFPSLGLQIFILHKKSLWKEKNN